MDKEAITMKAISVRQPWAWLIVNGHKDIENRDWPTKFRGPVYIHASKGMTRNEYEDAAAFARGLGVTVPPADQLERGGIVGAVHITDCVDDSGSRWFFGKFGFVLENATAIPFFPFRGQLGFFPVQHLLTASQGEG